MADWSQLPRELIQLIAERLERPIYVLRFRSVCASWRSSVSVKHPHLPGKFPVLSNDGTSQNRSFRLSKRSIFLISAPETHSRSDPDTWLIKIKEDARGRMEVRRPLSRDPIKIPCLDFEFPKVLDIYRLPVVELGQEYVLSDMNFRPFNVLGDLGSLYMEKVVFTWLNSESEEFVLLTIHVSGKLALFKSGDTEWTIIPDMPTPYDDVCVFNGMLYAVDNTGRTVVVGLDSNVSLVAEPVFGGDKKFLVESDGDLLLVDKHLSSHYVCLDVYDEVDDEICGPECEKAVKFDVFKLQEKEKKWVQLKSLGDRVLFLGDDCTFSASAFELSTGRGNCIIFRDDFVNVNGKESGVGVFDLDDNRISPLSVYPAYSKLFWPPPDWVRLLRQRD